MTRSRSFRFRYTLRALLVFVTLFMLWGGYHTNQSWREREAERILLEHHASLQYGPKGSRGTLLDTICSSYEKVVQIVWRQRFIRNVTIVTRLEPEVVDALVALPHLESLSVAAVYLSEEERKTLREQLVVHPHVSAPDDAISRVLAPGRLKTLNLSWFILSDKDCVAISRSGCLEQLGIGGCEFSEEGLVAIVSTPRLRQFNLMYCESLTGSKLASAPGSLTLEAITSEGVPLGGEFAAYVSRCRSVKSLQFAHKSIDDRFVAQLGPHPSITALDLYISSVTDATIPALQSMPSLQAVNLPRQTVTQQGVNRLVTAKPLVHVEY